MPDGYAAVNGLNMYYEIHGAGSPLALLHGGPSTIETDFGRVLPTFAKTRRVIAVEQQGHGHTADIDRPLTFEQMADDTAQLLRQLKIEDADFFGYSMGGGIALQTALRHPDHEHTVQMFRLFGGSVPGDLFGLPPSQLAVFPGTTHITLAHRADWLLR
jgi:pimeloyl-ACP methyl ester carboxylesterase